MALEAAVAQLSGVAGVKLKGLPVREFNGIYKPAGEHEGWPRFENAEGKHLFRFVADGEWYLEDDFVPESTTPQAYVASASGPLPVGRHEWECCADDGWHTTVVSCRLQQPNAADSDELQRLRKELQTEKSKRSEILADRDFLQTQLDEQAAQAARLQAALDECVSLLPVWCARSCCVARAVETLCPAAVCWICWME